MSVPSRGFHSTCTLLTLPRHQSSPSGLDVILSPGRGQAAICATCCHFLLMQPAFSCAGHGYHLFHEVRV
ncbi:Uncharacterized protein DAT39_011732, partial [Clarias magur]